MDSITGTVWNSGNRNEEIVNPIPLDQLGLRHAHEAQVGQPEPGNHGQGQEGQDSKRSWWQPSLLSHARITDTHLWRCVSHRDVLANREILNQERPDFAPATAKSPR